MFSYKDYDFENYIDVEEGSDGFIYGNYIDFLKFREECEEEILLNAGFDIPFGKNITPEEFDNTFNNESGLIEDELLDTLKEEVFGEDNYSNDNARARFIERNTDLADELVDNIFDNYGVPNDFVYEADLPDELKYWYYQSYDADLYEILRKHPIKLVDYENNINSIYEMIGSQENKLIKKSLILSSLIVTETMHKSVIVSKLDKQAFYNSKYRENHKKNVNDIMNSNIYTRNKWFEDLYKMKSPYQYWNGLRNSLAHSIDDVDIVCNTILYKNIKNDNLLPVDINQLRKDLLEFGENIKEIIDNSKDD